MVDLYRPHEATGTQVVSIDKRFPGQGMAAGQIVAASPVVKIAIVVDKDVDVMNITEVLHAVATRWQPHPATLIIPQANTFMVDPSLPQRFVTSKIIIDATRQLPLEGGPQLFPPLNRNLLKDNAPQSFEIVEKKWSEYLKDWEK